MNHSASLSRTLTNTVLPILSKLGNFIYWLAIIFLVLSIIVSTNYAMFLAFKELCDKFPFTKWFTNKAATEAGENPDLQTIPYIIKNIVLLNIGLCLGITLFKWFVYENVGLSIIDFILSLVKNII